MVTTRLEAIRSIRTAAVRFRIDNNDGRCRLPAWRSTLAAASLMNADDKTFIYHHGTVISYEATAHSENIAAYVGPMHKNAMVAIAAPAARNHKHQI